MRKGFAVLMLMLIMLVAIGCDETQYHKANQAAASISTALQGVQDFNVSLYRSGEINKEETIAIAMSVSDATLANDQFVAKMQTLNKIDASNKAEVAAWVGQLAASIDAMKACGVLHIKNPDKQKAFAVILQGIQASIQIIQVSIQ